MEDVVLVDYDNLLNDAIVSIKHLNPGSTFVLRDLYEGYIWGSLPRGDRLKFGGYFKRKVQSGKIEKVKYIFNIYAPLAIIVVDR